MNKKTLLILLGVMIALMLLSQVATRTRYATTAGGGFVDLIETFDRGEVSRVHAWLGAKTDSSVVLERNGDSWHVSSAWNWPAKESAMNGLFDNLDKLKGERRSSTDEVLTTYQLDDESGLHLIAENGGGTELFHLIVGKSVRGSNNFVRHAGASDAYVSNVNLRGSFGIWGDTPKPPAQTSWVDMKLLQLETADVDKIVIENEGATFTLEKEFAMIEPDSAAAAEGAQPTPDRNSWTWRPDDSGEIVKSKADGILNSLRSMNAADVADPDSLDAYGLGEGARVLTVALQDGTETSVRFGDVSATDENRIYVQVEGGKPAQMWKGTVDRIFVERSSLSPES